MHIDSFYLSCILTIFFHQTLTHALRALPAETTTKSLAITTTNMTHHESMTTKATSIKLKIDQSKDMIHDTFAQMDRGTIIRGTIVIAGITAVILMYIGLKAFLLRKKRQPKRYTLITDPTALEAPLFDGNDDDEEIEDDTLFVRK
ncbi:hypothetical protein I4U23_006369 [Adineta vaga]|nr:hypothetical protein I4U23_006369 [Adineta vaga]